MRLAAIRTSCANLEALVFHELYNLSSAALQPQVIGERSPEVDCTYAAIVSFTAV